MVHIAVARSVCPSGPYSPGEHWVPRQPVDAAAGAYCPGAHVAHDVSVGLSWSGARAALKNVPATQAMHADAPSAAWYVPPVHHVQDVAPDPGTCRPLPHALHEAMPMESWNRPFSHRLQLSVPVSSVNEPLTTGPVSS